MHQIARGGLLICRGVDPGTAPLIGFLIFQAIWQYQTWSLSLGAVIGSTGVCAGLRSSEDCDGNMRIRSECIAWKALNEHLFKMHGKPSCGWANSFFPLICSLFLCLSLEEMQGSNSRVFSAPCLSNQQDHTKSFYLVIS